MKLVRIIAVLLLPLISFSQPDPPYPASPATATNITAAEYYFDTDPGFGNGIPISITLPVLDLALSNVPLDISSLSEGVHTVFIRTQNANGEWSQTSNRMFVIEPNYSTAPQSPPNIVAAEYFTSGSGFGGDPGFGSATPITIPSGQTDFSLTNEPVSITGLGNGINYLYLRTQNADGEWSQTSIKEFTIVNDPAYPSAPPTPTDIVAAEYYFDDDPGFGSGTSIPITPGQDISLNNIGLDISGLGQGVHFMFLRTQNADGEWSQTSSREFEIVDDPVYPTAPPATTDIVAAEYYFDDDPDFGSGTSIPITSGQDVTISNFSLDVSALGEGIHYVFIRTLNADGEWSQTSSREFEIVLDFAYPTSPPAPTNIISAEYFIDSDPGFGLGTSIAITPNLDISLTNISLNITGLNLGTHTIFLRTQNNDGEWSQTSNRDFTIQELTDCTTTSTWDGTSWSNGVPDSTTNAIINGDFALSADAEWCGLDILSGSFTIDQGVKLTLNDTNTTLRVESSGELNAEGTISCAGDIENNNIITFNSNLTGTGQFDVFTGSISGTGDVTVERFIPAKRAFRFLSSAVTTTDFILENWQQNGLNPGDSGYMPNTGTQITGGIASLGFDQSGSNNPSMFTFNNAFVPTGAQTQGDAWTPLPNTNTTRLNVGKGYLTMVRGDRSIDLTTNSAPATETTLIAVGDLFTGPNSPTLSNEFGLYSLVANPYQAVVDYSLTSRADLTDFIYVWDASIGGNNGRGGYVTVEISSNSITDPNPTSSDASKFIAPGMAFFVQNLSSGSILPSLTFNESNKATGENQVTVFNVFPHFYINSRLYISSDLQNGNSERDAIGLRFSNNFNTLGSDEDATKIGNPDENFAVINNGSRSIDKQAMPNSGHKIDLSIINYTATNYSLDFVVGNKPEDVEVFLKDDYLNTQAELTQNFVYDFSVDQNIPESTSENRFSLIFDNSTLNVDDNSFGQNFSIYPNPTSNAFFSIKTPNLSGEVGLKITNMIGQQILHQELLVEGQQVSVNYGHLPTGVYVVELSQGNKSYSAKLIVE